MNRRLLLLPALGAGLAFLPLFCRAEDDSGPAQAPEQTAPQEAKPKPKRDPRLWTGISKSGVEGPILRRLRGRRAATPAQPRRPIPLSTGASRRVVEAPVKRALRRAPRPIPLSTGNSKRVVEGPLKRALRRAKPVKRFTPAPKPGERVQPGLVTWHKSYEAALAAAKRSGKPVLLVHTMGRLDDRFC